MDRDGESELGGDAGRDVFTMWTIYHSPRDSPGLYAVRAFDIVRGLIEPVPREHYEVMPSLEMARDCVPRGLYRLERSEGDDPSVVETWM